MSQSSNSDEYRIESRESGTNANAASEALLERANANQSPDPECPRCDRPLTPGAVAGSYVCWKCPSRITWIESDTGGLMLGGEY